MFYTVAKLLARKSKLYIQCYLQLDIGVKPHESARGWFLDLEDSSSLLILGQFFPISAVFLTNVQLMLDISNLSAIII